MIDTRPAGSTTVAGAKPGAGRRPGMGKAALGRAKLATIALSAVAFVGALAGVIQATPNTIKATAAQPAAVAPAAQRDAQISGLPQRPRLSGGSANPLVLPQRPQMPQVRPFTRTRGS